jgi:hypothetical protein
MLPSNTKAQRYPTLIKPEMADAAAMRHWLRHDVQYAVAAVQHRRLTERDGLHFLITTALDKAERADIAPDCARQIAVTEFRDALTKSEAKHAKVLAIMADAAVSALRAGKSRKPQAWAAATKIARAHAAPAHLIEEAQRIAYWRLRQPPTEGGHYG